MWFEKNGLPVINSEIRSSNSYVSLFPVFVWDLAELQEDSTWTVVELDWEYENGCESVATSEVKAFQESKGIDEPSQIVRLVVMKNKSTGDIFGFKMVVTPDMSYFLNRGDDISTNKYLSRDGGLSGLVMFYSLDGDFVNGWYYVEGSVAGKVEESGIELSETITPVFSTLRSTVEFITVWTCYYSQSSIDGGETWSDLRLEGCTSKVYSVIVDNSLADSWRGGGFEIEESKGGGGSSAIVNTVSPYASAIFRNSNWIEENWKKLEKMIEKIRDNCLGVALYNGLKNLLGDKSLTIQFNSGNSSSFFFDGETAGISLSMNMESNHLFHEMWHAYQAYQETASSYAKSKLNREIETWYAQYLFVSSLPEYKPGSSWHDLYNYSDIGKAIRLIEEHVDSKGNLISNETALYNHLWGIKGEFDKLENTETNQFPYKDYPFDHDRSAISNFANIKNLSRNCN